MVIRLIFSVTNKLYWGLYAPTGAMRLDDDDDDDDDEWIVPVAGFM